jgi:TP901 family phage tail tape measure protein
MAYQLGNAEGEIKLSAKGVKAGVDAAEGHLGRLGRSTAKHAKAMTTTLAVAGTAIAAAFAGITVKGIKMAADLEAQMGGIKAVMQESDEVIEQLRDHIIQLGVDPGLKVDTMEAADAIEMLGRNGLSAQEILDGAARSTILLANATGGTFAQSADIATDVMALWNIEAGEMKEAVDAITSVVNNSKFSIDDFEYSLATAGGVAKTAGVGLSDFTTVVAGIAPYFNSGKTAGTSFKTMLQRMAAPSNTAAEAMEELGLNFFDAEGKMKGMAEISSMLHEALNGTSMAMVEVGGRTAEQNAALKELQAAYSKAADKITSYEIGAAGASLSDEDRAEKIEALNEQMADYQAAMEPLLGIQGEYIETTKTLTQEEKLKALSTMFGADAVRAAAALADKGAVAYEDLETASRELGVEQDILNKYMEGGITQFEALQAQMEQTDADEAVKARMDNLKGSMEILRGAVEATLIKLGTPFLGVLKQLADGATQFVTTHGQKLVDWFEGLSEVLSSLFSGNIAEAPWEKIVPAGLAAKAQTIAGAVQTVVDSLRSGEGLVESVAEGFAELGVPQDIIDRLVAFAETAKEFLIDNKDAIVDGLKAIGIAIAAFAGLTVLASIAGFLMSMVNPLTIILALIGLVAAAWSGNWGGMRTKVMEFYEAVKPKIEEIAEKIGSFVEGVKGFIEDFKGAFDDGHSALGAFQTALEGIGLPEDVMTKLGDLLEIVGSIKNYFADMGEGGADLGGWLDNLPEAIQPVVEAFGQLVDKAREVGDQIKEFVEEKAERISEWFEENGPLIREFAEVIGTVLGTAVGVLAFVWAKVWTAVLGLWNVLEPILSAIIELVLGLVKTVMQVVTGDWEGAWETIKETAETIWEKLKEAGQAFIDWIGDTFGGIWEAVKDWWSDTWEGIKSGITGWWDDLKDSVKSMVQDFVDGIVEKVEGFVDQWKANWDLLKLMVLLALIRVKLAIQQKWQDIVDWFNDKIDAVKEIFANIWNGAKEKTEEIWENIKQAIYNKLIEIFEAMGLDFEEFREEVRLLWEDIKLIFVTVWERIKTAVSEKVQEIVGPVIEKINEFKEALATKWEEIRLAVSEKWEAIKSSIIEKWELIKIDVATKIDELKTGMATKWDEVKTAIGAKWEEIKTFIGEKWDLIKTLVAERILGLITPVNEKHEEVKTAVGGKWEEIKGKIDEWWTTIKEAVGPKIDAIKASVLLKFNEIKSALLLKLNEWRAVGEAIIDGIKSGIANAAGRMVQRALQAARDAVEAVKNWLGIQSPSKKFMEIGVASAEGMEVGFASMERRIANAARRLGQAAFGQLDLGGFAQAAAGVQALPSPGGAAPSTHFVSQSSKRDVHIYGPITLQVEGGTDAAGLLEMFAELDT